ncbi:MAG: hypothetical protein U5L11_03345 [Arhodomonas sp.]|nr:hypothetical protein [Arhodomonas sp.]
MAGSSASEVGGVSLEWLATGRGTPDAGAVQEEPAAYTPRADGTTIDLDLLEEVVTITREILTRRGIHLKPAAEGRLIRVLYWHFASRADTDTPTISNIIDLASYQ